MLTIFFIIFLIIGVPIAITIGMATLLVMIKSGMPIEVAAQRIFGGVDSFSLMAIPFFVFAGDLMLVGGTSRRLINFANKIVGSITGGIPITAVIASMFFAALSGSSPATVAAVGGVMIPSLEEAKYSKKFSVGLICAAGSLGIIIPPSITMLTYGVVSELSISDLFLAALVPGIFIGLVLILTSYIVAKKQNYKPEPRAPFKEVVKSGKEAIWSILMPVIVLGGIYSGIATPTEAAAVAIVYSLFISIVLHKELKIKDLLGVAKKSVVVSAMIMFVIATSKLFSWYLTIEQVPTRLASMILQVVHSPILIIVAINIVLLIVGMIMDTSAAVLILTPLFLPIVIQIGMNPIHFGVIMIVNLAIGMLTPPFGLNLFVAAGITNMSMTDVIKGSLPFILVLLVTLVVIVAFPQLSLLFI
jgi:C4-dicarboxylate transporter DctM subunit